MVFLVWAAPAPLSPNEARLWFATFVAPASPPRPAIHVAFATELAAVSAGNDDEIGRMIAEAMDKVSADGVITVEESKSLATEL